MKPIEHYMLPENTNRLYKEEARSSIGLTRDVAAKINEIIDALNELSQVDLTWKQTQEGIIRGGVLYMKDNLVNTLHDLLEMYVANGFIDTRIEILLEGLSERLDNLLGKVQEGSTTMDAEIIDARFTGGVTHDNLGQAIRRQGNVLSRQIAEVFSILDRDQFVHYEVEAGYIDSSMSLRYPNVYRKEITTDLIPLGTDDVYMVKTFCNYPADGVPYIGVTYYDDLMVPISRDSVENETERVIFRKADNIAYFRVSTRTYGNGSMAIMKKNLERVSATIPIFQHKYDYQYKPMNMSLGYLNSEGALIAPNPYLVEMVSDLVPVNPGEKYALILNAVNTVGIVGNNAGYLWGAVAYYDAEGNFLYRPYSYPVSEEREDQTYSMVGEFTIPAGVAFVRVMGRTYWNGTINLAQKRDVIKGDSNTIAFENLTAGVKGIAHRGYSAGAPENTISAFKLAKQNGFYYVEGDVRFTSDGVPVMLHDATVERTSNGSGNISGMTLSQVKALDFGSWFSPAYAGETIPTFEEFITLCKRIGLHAYIELKAGTQAQIEALVTTVRSYGMQDKVTWIGGSPYITYVPAVVPGARIGVVVSSVTDGNITEAKRMLTGQNEVFMDSSTWTEEEISKCKQNGIGLEVWTVNNEQTILELPAYVSGVTSDNCHAGIVLYENTL